MKRILLLVLAAIALFAGEGVAADPPVFVGHTLTGSSGSVDGTTLFLDLRVENPTDAPLYDLTLTLAPGMVIFTEPGMTVTVGSLAPRARATLPIVLNTPMQLTTEELARHPLPWVGACRDAGGANVDFPVIGQYVLAGGEP